MCGAASVLPAPSVPAEVLPAISQGGQSSRRAPPTALCGPGVPTAPSLCPALSGVLSPFTHAACRLAGVKALRGHVGGAGCGAAVPWASVGSFPGGHGEERLWSDAVMQKGCWSGTLRAEQWSVEMEPHALGWEAQ